MRVLRQFPIFCVKMNVSIRVFLFLSSLSLVVVCDSSLVLSSIPSQLLECYRSGGPEMTAPHRLDVLLQILRKLETHRSQLDLRLFSTALLRSLRLDGIQQGANPIETEHLTPYRATSFQFQRYKLLMDLFLPSQNMANVTEDLDSHEKCLFHKMVSSTVRRWERGDEDQVCPMSIQQRQNVVLRTDIKSGRGYSRCPIEDGVVQTNWGTIAPGTVIAAIAAAMEGQTVAVTDVLNTNAFKTNIELREDSPDFNVETLDEVIVKPRIANAEISNVWVATLAGDLAEVAVNQGPRVGAVTQNITIGSNNKWNDTLLPRIYYIFPQNESVIQWHMTDAEIIAGIDGLIIAKEVRKWTTRMGSLRLSQILDMYYSHEGVSFDYNIKACNRQANFYKVFDRAELLQEMSNFAQILSLSQGTVYVPIEEVDKICTAVVDTFVSYLSDVLNRNQVSCDSHRNVATMDLVLVTDGAWTQYETEQYVSAVSHLSDMSLRRTTLGFMQGNTAQWIAHPASNIIRIFSDIHNYSDEWPNRLNFPNVLTALIQYLNNKTNSEASTGASVAAPTVVLIASPHDRLTTTDIELSRQIMQNLRRNYFDVHFVYISRDVSGFYDLNSATPEPDLYIELDSTSVEEVIQKVKEEVINSQIPKRVIGTHCDVNGTVYAQVPYEDYVSVGQKILYRINEYYLQIQSLVQVKFRTMNQGEVRVCSTYSGEGDLHCLQLGPLQTATYNLSEPCLIGSSTNTLCSKYFSVTGVTTSNVCANTDCRLPSQVGFYVEHTGLRCLTRTNHASRSIKDNLFLFYCTLAYFIYTCFNNLDQGR